jgi:hypothetical protein
MRDFLAVVGAVLLIGCLWLGLITFNQGGVQRVDESGHPAEVLTSTGWQPVAGGSATAAQAGIEKNEPKTERKDSAAVLSLTNEPLAPYPTATPPPTVAFYPTVVPPARAVAEMTALPIEPVQESGPATPPGQADAVLGPDPIEATLYAAAPIDVSPWEVLGWILVGSVPVGGLTILGLVVHRHVSLTAAQAEAVRRALSTASPGGTAEGETKSMEMEGAETVRSVPLEDYLFEEDPAGRDRPAEEMEYGHTAAVEGSDLQYRPTHP